MEMMDEHPGGLVVCISYHVVFVPLSPHVCLYLLSVDKVFSRSGERYTYSM